MRIGDWSSDVFSSDLAESVQWLEKHLIDYADNVILVTHDSYFLDNVVGWVLELDRGRGIPFAGNYTKWLEGKAKRMEQDKREEKGSPKAIKEELEGIGKDTTRPEEREVGKEGDMTCNYRGESKHE